MLEPITVDLETASRRVLAQFDCAKHLLQEVYSARDDWPQIREAWVAVALALLTDARLDCNLPLFEQRVEALQPYVNDDPDVAHRIWHERSLWAVFSLNVTALDELLDSWSVEDCDPAWLFRKAALLTELHRYDESTSLIQRALKSLRQDILGGRSIAASSREAWALASTVTTQNRQSIAREWDRLASLRCDAGSETDAVIRAMKQSDEKTLHRRLILESHRACMYDSRLLVRGPPDSRI